MKSEKENQLLQLIEFYKGELKKLVGLTDIRSQKAKNRAAAMLLKTIKQFKELTKNENI